MTADPAALQSADGDNEFSRREFLNYAWLATLGILAIQGGLVTFRFAMPILKKGEFGSVVPIGNVDDLPAADASPEAFKKAKFWWVQTEEGAIALYTVCTHLGCIYDWKDTEFKFICPCHGSQFEREGDFILGPAPRGLDRFVIRAYDGAGNMVAETGPDGGPVQIPPGSTIEVDTGDRISGPSV